VVHYLWLVKKDITDPLIYAVILALLLAYRLVVAVRKQQSVELSGSVTTTNS